MCVDLIWCETVTGCSTTSSVLLVVELTWLLSSLVQCTLSNLDFILDD